MLYDQYVEKMKKVISTIKLVYRFRVLLIILILVSTGLFGAFTVTKGTIQEINPPTELIYGEEYNPTSSALFSKTTIQYRIAVENSQWTEEKPVNAGTYYMRVVSSGILGNKYSDEILFTISKKDLTVTSCFPTIKSL